MRRPAIEELLAPVEALLVADRWPLGSRGYALFEAPGRSTHVHLDVEVPDFAKAKVSMSGVIVANPVMETAIAPTKLLADLVPDIPTAQRTFSKTADHVFAYAKLFQGGNGKLAVRVRVLIDIENARHDMNMMALRGP